MTFSLYISVFFSFFFLGYTSLKELADVYKRKAIVKVGKDTKKSKSPMPSTMLVRLFLLLMRIRIKMCAYYR